VADIYLAEFEKEPAAAPGSPVTLSSQELSRYPGLYLNRDKGETRRVLLNDRKLRLQSPGTGGFEMKPVGPDRFQLAGSAVEVRFSAAESGGALRLTEIAPGGAEPEFYDFTPEFRLTAAQLSEYAGDYRSGEIEAVYRVEAQQDKLVLRRLKATPDTLDPIAKDLFRGALGIFEFRRDNNGRVSGFILNSGRVRNFRFRRQSI